jgi:hypothetical protein
MSHTTANKEFWREFIQLYRSLPELWKVKSDVYKNRKLKDAGYNVLVEKLREIEEDADRDMVRRKINGLRTAYRREKKKKTDSTKSGIVTDYMYVPSLWYFNDLDFLQHHEIEVAGKSTMEDEPEQEDKETSPVSQYAFFIVFIQTFLFTLFLLHYVI